MNGLPTFFLVLLLAYYLKFMFFKPLDKVLAERHSLTEGARQAAEESLKAADSKISEYEARLNQARSEIYREQELFLRKLNEEQAAQARASRAESDAQIAEIKRGIATEAEAARASLSAQSDVLAGQIADAILLRRVA